MWVLSKDEYEVVLKCKELILANKYTYPYFINNHLDQELLHQVEVYFQFENLDFKALLDGILIDHTNKTIQPFDLKTSSKSVYEFENSFLTYGYYRQCALYDYAIKQKESPVYTYIEDGYEVLDFIFIVVETKNYSYHPAVIYKTNENTRLAGMEGATVNNRFWPGVKQLVENYKWHLQNDEWDMPADLIKSEGIIDIKCF